ncbi:RNA 2'-phosphotransferase [Acetilactobacillus jinshanensis]|uniref:RNA 2'-phosphotransferase n=1 Tax=Acetilactobacillus jinshanensis TaxID=1720083 RepID=UPI001583158B|nr:RNA 2'-phosphotransferase [Acetilactobacillus jinshanensis]
MNYKLTKISKRISYILRHHPEQIGIHLDTYGRVDLKLFITKFNHYYRRSPISVPLIVKIMKNSDKKRLAIDNGTIRALYGHSVPGIKPLSSPTTPPKILFHGTTHHAARLIQTEGIKKMDRDFVHLSSTTSMAHQVGARRDPHPVIFNVHARQASKDGLTFYPTASGIWLVDYVPPKYLTIRK